MKVTPFTRDLLKAYREEKAKQKLESSTKLHVKQTSDPDKGQSPSGSRNHTA